MVRRTVRLTGPDTASVAALQASFDQLRATLGIPAQFPPEVLAAATASAAADHATELDLRDLGFVTVDPPGSTDLDQAMHLTRDGTGYRVDYAIADVPAFVPDGGPVDGEARRRGQTLYAPDRRTPLHPQVLSESAASLLEGQDRPAFVWRFTLDAQGQVSATELVHATIRNRHRLSYDEIQAAADAHAGSGPDQLPDDDVAAQAVLLRAIGLLRIDLQNRRGGANLPLPEQEVNARDGHYALELRPGLAAEDWNAQLSLMTGMAAAQIMLAGRAGLLRTLPTPDAGAVDRFRRQAAALGVAWPEEESHGDLLRRLRRDDPRELALMYQAGALFRGAGYTPIDPDPATALPTVTTHAAVAAPYAHVTAPLRRLVDRFGLVTCLALSQGRPVPPDVLAAIPLLPAVMAASDQLAGALDRGCLDIVEAAVLADHVGQQFDAVVVEQRHHGLEVQLVDPAVIGLADGQAELGARVKVTLTSADLATGTVRFAVGGQTP